jgi:polysaccharide biosynthesis transport protein
MLDRVNDLAAISRSNQSPQVDGVKASHFRLDDLIAAARRQWVVVVYCMIAALGLGLIYLVTAVPQYTANVDILIDSRKSQDQLSSTIAELTLDTGAIDSQVEVLKSDNIALGVVDALALDQEPEFNGSGQSIFGVVLAFIRNILDVRNWFTETDIIAIDKKQKARENAVSVLHNRVNVKRVARTYVLTIAFTWPDRRKAQTIANAFADAYFSDQLDSRYVIAKRAAGWLNDRIAELKENSLRTDLAVQKFKAEKGILATGSVVSSGTQKSESTNLVADQQLIEMTTQISQAHSDTARMEARLRQIRETIAAGKMDGAVTDTLGSPVITDLRQKYLRASKTAAELSAKIGDSHYQVLSLKNEMAQYERLLFEELQRIGETYASDLQVSRAREVNLNEMMATLIGQKAASNETMVHLRELEREADVFKNLYDTFLQRYQDALQRESFPNSEARVISPASHPEFPSWPKTPIVLVGSAFLGLLLGFGVAAYREEKDRVFRVAHQVRDELSLGFIGMLPAVASEVIVRERENPEPRHIQLNSTIQKFVITAPLSGFAEVLRSAKVEVDLALAKKEGPKVIGIVSVLPSEGKTTVAKNLGSLLSFLGCRTLLIDSDLRQPGLTRGIASHASFGLLEVLRGDCSLEEALLLESESGLSVLPAVVKKKLYQSSELMSSDEMAKLFEDAGKKFAYIVVDLPPVGPVIDVRAAGHLFDAFLLVIEWGKTPRSVVKSAMVEDRELYQKCTGVIYNKVNPEKLRLYNSEGAKSYYYHKYGNYYIDKPQSKGSAA